ncbi:MAG TPA: polysaccharide deacetylase family protein [Bacteroidia bacterium]
MTKPATICLTFDLEEFDLPLEFKQKISKEKQMEIATQGMETLLPLLKDISCTFFTTAHYAENNQALVKELSATHEIASHCYYHSSFDKTDLKKSKDTLQTICGTEILGFRMPRMANVNYKDIRDAGYLYDSSLNPTFIPGRYNHFTSSKTIFKTDNDLLVFPASVTPFLRTPLFWLTFKNSSSKWYCKQVQKCLGAYGYANIYLHPWEFTDVSEFSFPSYIATNPDKMQEKLNYLINHFKDKAHFTSIKSLLKERNEL